MLSTWHYQGGNVCQDIIFDNVVRTLQEVQKDLTSIGSYWLRYSNEEWLQDIAHPDFSHPDISNPDFSHPDISHPDISHPDFSHPDFSHPDISHPDFSHPDISHPDISHPSFSNPDISHLDFFHPDFSHPYFFINCENVGSVLWTRDHLSVLISLSWSWINIQLWASAVHYNLHTYDFVCNSPKMVREGWGWV